MFGQESQAKQQRVERSTSWIRDRTPWSLGAVLFGAVSMVDAFTILIGIASGIAAIVCGVVGLRDIAVNPHLLGSKLCRAAIVMGCLGIVLSLVMLTIVYPMLARD